MQINTRIKPSFIGLIAALGVFCWVLPICIVDDLRAEQAGKPAVEKPNVNNLCYVCHFDLLTEKIATAHLAKGITCDKCHGPSNHHMHDEMLMTKPDLLFGRAEVEKMCRNCHQPHADPAAVEAFRKNWLGRARPNGRIIGPESVCTDCHGTHNIVKQMGTQSEKGQPAEWIAAFNGQDLAGWQSSGSASWTVKNGRIIATPGRKGAGGDLWTLAAYEDYLMSVTFRATWPIHAGIWLRTAGDQQGPRVEIFESRKPAAFTGSVWVPGKGLALANFRKDLVQPESWNTLSVEVRGDRLAVWLNGEQLGMVRADGPAKGKIGFHIERSRASKASQLCIREVLVQPLTKTTKKVSKLSPD